MLTSVLIIVFSLILLVYWFRYTCLLILRAGSPSESTQTIATVNHLNFPVVQKKLKTAGDARSLDPLWRSLEKDYRILHYLLGHAAGLGLPSLERFLLVCDYRIMQVCYRLTRHSSGRVAREALNEMSTILSYLSHRMGERSAHTA